MRSLDVSEQNQSPGSKGVALVKAAVLTVAVAVSADALLVSSVLAAGVSCTAGVVFVLAAVVD